MGEANNAALANRIVERMGFPASETGPYVSALRRHVEHQVDRGLVSRSAGWWSPEGRRLSLEDRAREILAFDWAAERYSYRTENIDGAPWGWRTDVRSMSRRFEVQWRRVPSWFIGDPLRRYRALLRRWWDREVRGIRNPYLAPEQAPPAQRGTARHPKIPAGET
jgi:hypothetical protein